MRRFSVEEYHEMARVGILTEADRVELLEGWIVPKLTKTPPHDAVIRLVDAAIRPLIPVSHHLRIQSAITLALSEPEPDITVVTCSPHDYLNQHPSSEQIGLVIEVAESSLSIDRRKRQIYAEAGIPAYWIVNLTDGCVEVYTQPSRTAEESGYTNEQTLTKSDSISLKIDGDDLGSISVADILP